MSGMRVTDFDRIAASAPLNKTASVVRDGVGEHWESRATGQPHWDVAPSMGKRPDHVQDLNGTRYGRLQVVGYMDKGKSGHRWAVRCSCGAYEHRTHRALVTPGANSYHEPMCRACGRLEYFKVEQRAAVVGKWPDGRPYDRVGLRTTPRGGQRLLDPATTPTDKDTRP